MAFLCPVRIRRGKKKKNGDGDCKESPGRGGNVGGGGVGGGGVGGVVGVGGPGMGRITGSASIETLVRVGIEKENGLSPDSKMVVLHDFTPCVDDELEVKRGHIVNVLYRENDWVYVIAEDRQEGFIPHSYCAPFGSHVGDLALSNVRKKLPRAEKGGDSGALEGDTSMAEPIGGGSGPDGGSDGESHGGGLVGKKGGLLPLGHRLHQVNQHQGQQMRSSQGSLHSASSSQPDIHPFFKDPSGRYIVLYTFIARDENDVSVERGEFVTVLNREDPDWYWVLRSDGQEGFVPSGFVYPADVIQGHLSQTNCQNQNNNFTSTNNNHHLNSPSSDDLRFHGTELVMLYDYKAQAPDDLSVRRGDWIYADLSNQTVDGWLWAYAPKTRKYGFIPKAYARPPAMTSL
ncbi:SH3 domain-containing protein Dlish [Hetaerina americana]|uniref:SH3 domain-containing protein Dlish n=1 Tax=Hetaerina americana TaxID=62018 RepID=UPI003A7F3C79